MDLVKSLKALPATCEVCDDCHAESEDVPRCPLCGDPTCGGWCG